MVTSSSANLCRPLSSSAVLTTLRNAAGDAKTMVASPAIAASANAVAVRVAGLVTDIFGVTEVAPMAGPSKANGANPANRSEEHTSELQARDHHVCRHLHAKKESII